MLDNILLTIYVIIEAINQRALLQLFHEQVFIARVIVPVTTDLSRLTDQQNPFQNSDYQFEELTKEDLSTKKMNFSLRSRFFKSKRNLKRGLRGFVLSTGTKIIGDIWCDAPLNISNPVRHPDFDMLGIPYNEKDAYTLNIFIDPAYRGKKLAVPLHRSLQLQLKREGWRRVLAYYYEDNIPSKWMHWMLKFEEQPKVRISRFFFVIKTNKNARDYPSM